MSRFFIFYEFFSTLLNYITISYTGNDALFYPKQRFSRVILNISGWRVGGEED